MQNVCPVGLWQAGLAGWCERAGKRSVCIEEDQPDERRAEGSGFGH